MIKYDFELTSRSVQSSRSALHSEFVVAVLASKFCSTSLYLQFSLTQRSGDLKVKQIEFRANESVEELEHIGFLRGSFGFANRRELDAALANLVKILNEESAINNTDSRWQDFKEQFVEWYNAHIKPLINAETEIFNRYSSHYRPTND